MSGVDSSRKAWLNKIYLNLDNDHGGSPHHYKVDFSYDNLINQISVPDQIQVSLPESFRESIIRESGLYQYQVKNPLDLKPELRTERWQTLCDNLTNYSILPKSNKIKIVKLLSSLCFHQAVLQHVPITSEDEIANDSDSADLAFSRAMSNLLIHSDQYLPYDYKELEVIAKCAPVGRMVRIAAGLQILVQLAKVSKNLEGAEFWRSIITQEIELIMPYLSDFSAKLLMSIYYRAAVFIPLLKKDQKKVVIEMDLCQSYSESLSAETQEQQIIAYENLSIIGESRTKEAMWLKDFDLAEERARKLVNRNVLDPRYQLELGEILLKRGKLEEAAKVYHRTTRLGPPGTAIAWFMAGQCYQSLSELELACDCYLSCLDCDPLAISAVRRLSKISSFLGDVNLSSWCEIRLSQLEREKQVMADGGSNFSAYIPASSMQAA